MSIKTREQIIEQIKTTFADNTSDEAIALIEDVTDTLTDFEAKVNGGGEDWKAKYEKNDKEWREKYIARFSSNGKIEDDNIDDKGGQPKTYAFENLFSEGEK